MLQQFNKKDQEAIKKNMEKLGLSQAEAIELLMADKEINKDDGRTFEFDLTPEQEKISKQARETTAPKVYTFGKKKRKKDEEKSNIVSTIIDTLTLNGCKIEEVLNPEREFTFIKGDTLYKITLSKPRIKKEV